MIRRILLALTAAAIVIFATIVAWENLQQNETRHIARIAESESYATRSRMVRNVDAMLRALRDVQIYWSTFGRVPRRLWADDASIDASHFEGIRLIVWSDPGRDLRFARKPSNPVFDHRPDDEEWARYEYLLAKSRDLKEDQILGPYEDDNGRTELEIILVPKAPRVDGTLIAVMDTRQFLQNILQEDSPGYAITVKAGDSVIYERGEPMADRPESWVRSGFIRNSAGMTWEVTHAPTAELAQSLKTPAVDAVLYAGVGIAILMGLLLLESGRAGKRAREATLAQARLAELNRELEQQVAERTRELEERSRDLVTIADSVSHDLRNPLNAISANIQLLDQQVGAAMGASGRKIIEKLSAAVSQMVDILDRLLNLSMVSQKEFERKRLNMKQLAEEIFEELEISDPGPPVDFLADDVPEAYGEPVMVQILILNLLGNALKYTRSKTDRKVIFSHTRVDDLQAYYVQDNGIGFDSDIADRMFAAFERLHDAKEEGLGLGLDIASRVVRRHQGRIWAEGKPGQGATVYFTLGKDSVVV